MRDAPVHLIIYDLNTLGPYGVIILHIRLIVRRLAQRWSVSNSPEFHKPRALGSNPISTKPSI
jgi:hypothetical protein